MSANTSPSMTSLSMNSPSVADSSETDATSRSSNSPDDLTIISGISNLSVNNNNSKDLPWILHRILECQLSCELPLRIMFAFNAGQKLPTLKQAQRYWQYGQQGKLLIAFLSSQEMVTPSVNDATLEDLQNPPCGPPEIVNPDHHANDRFMDRGNEFLLDIDFSTIEQGRRQSEGLPPSFVQKLCLNTIFSEDYEESDFVQALTGLDYIRDLEVTRRVSLREAAQRLGITKENWRDVLAEDPDAKQWVENMQALEIDVATYYATIFVDLRIWTMINELQCKTFYKPNVLAMLNTLFPPCVRELPNDKIDKSVLHKYRANFYHYILAVEKQGPSILKPWVEGLLKPGTKHSWSETRNNLVLYFDRADNMINASTAIHGIEFFRDRSSKYPGIAPFVNERPATGDSGNTFNTSSQRSDKSQVSVTSSVPRSPARTFDSSIARKPLHSRHKISTAADQKTYFEPPDSPWASQQTFHNSNNSTQSLRSGTPNILNASRSSTPQVETSPLKSRTRPQSRPTTPFVEHGSEAAKHDSFTRPITPFEDKRREVIARRETVSGQPKTALELSHTLPHAAVGNFYNSRPGSRKTSSHSIKTPLLNDNLEFLKRPYKPEPLLLPLIPTDPTLKKKSSFGSLFLRKKSSASSIATMRDDFNNDSLNALGIEMAPLKPIKSTETFPRLSQEAYSMGSTLRKQISFIDPDKSEKLTMHSFRSRAASGLAGSGLTEIAEDENLKRKLKKKSSLPNFGSKPINESGAMKQKFVATGDDYERITVINVPRPATSHGPTQKKAVRKAKSFASIRSWTTTNTTDTKKTVPPRKSSVFRREPQEGERIRGKTISEPFPMKLHDSPSLLTPESQSKEWTRKYFIEQARAKRYDLNPPEGDPMQEGKEKVGEKKGGLEFFKKEKEVVAVEEKEFEYPRATPKIPVRPNKQKWDSIFPRRPVEKKKPTMHTPIDLSKYTKYPGKNYV